MKFLIRNNIFINFMDKFLIFLTDVPYAIFGTVNSIFIFIIVGIKTNILVFIPFFFKIYMKISRRNICF